MTDAYGKEVRRLHRYEDPAWDRADHETCVRAEGRRYSPARMYDRPQVSERDAACQSKRAIKKAVPPGSIVVATDKARPGRRLAKVKVGHQPDLFE